MTRAVLFDTETTGLEWVQGHRVIEVAALELVNDLPTGRHFHALIDPERDIPEEVDPHPRHHCAACGRQAAFRGARRRPAGVLRRRQADRPQRAVRLRLPECRAGADRPGRRCP